VTVNAGKPVTVQCWKMQADVPAAIAENDTVATLMYIAWQMYRLHWVTVT